MPGVGRRLFGEFCGNNSPPQGISTNSAAVRARNSMNLFDRCGIYTREGWRM
jgi:hypothetical protein